MQVRDQTLDFVSEYKHLGVLLDERPSGLSVLSKGKLVNYRQQGIESYMIPWFPGGTRA